MRTILTNWTIMRLLRLVIALAILIQAVYQKDFALGVLAVLLMLSAIANVGCCGAGGCKVDLRTTKTEKEITYEELDNKK
jgi:hypothetical protein